MEVSEILETVDIESYISQYCDLEERGGELWGLSPFKEENTPSFAVNPEKRIWYDFSSGYGGNLVEFVMRHDHIGLRQAVEKIKKFANIREDGTSHSRMLATTVAKRFRETTKPTKVSTSSVLPCNTMERYEFRKDKLKLWADEGIKWDVMKRFEVRYDAFDNRIVFPIKSYDGDIISVCGRTCDPDFKTKKLRKYTYFQSIGTIDTLYGFSENREEIMAKKEIVIFEGAKSVMLAYGWGIRNTAAILTSHLSQNQFTFLVKLGNLKGVRIVFALDSEVDITKDANVSRLASYARVEWIKNIDGLLAEKESPVDKGLEVFKTLYERRLRVYGQARINRVSS